eukprot:gene58357-biopygen22601
MAPELITDANSLGAHATKVDVWSLGCTVVEILNKGEPPWRRFESQWACLHHIAVAEEAPDGIPDTLSEHCRHFVVQCFIRDPPTRPSIVRCLQHEWLATVAGSGSPGGSARYTGARHRQGTMLNIAEGISGLRHGNSIPDLPHPYLCFTPLHPHPCVRDS